MRTEPARRPNVIFKLPCNLFVEMDARLHREAAYGLAKRPTQPIFKGPLVSLNKFCPDVQS